MPPVSKIARLPAELREWLNQAIVERAYGDIVALTDELNALCKAGGIAITIGKSAIGAESQRVKRAQESIAAATRHMQLIADTAPDHSDKRGEALNAMVSEGLFEALLYAREAEAEADPAKRIGLMNKAALASARLTTTSVRQRQHRHGVESRAKLAADQVSKIAKAGGLTKAQQAEIRSSILGIAKPAAAAAPQGAP